MKLCSSSFVAKFHKFNTIKLVGKWLCFAGGDPPTARCSKKIPLVRKSLVRPTACDLLRNLLRNFAPPKGGQKIMNKLIYSAFGGLGFGSK